MRQAMISIASLCILAAFCAEITKGSRFTGVIRMVLGLEISWAVLLMLSKFARSALEWS